MMIVAAGLNRKSGTGVAAALMPSLTVDGTRVFSLVYGSGINDQDILDKYDALLIRSTSRGRSASSAAAWAATSCWTWPRTPRTCATTTGAR